MDNLDAARLQMAFTLMFHIVFACIGMVMPFFMVVSHYKWLKTRNPIYLTLTKAWQKGVAIFFVTGAVSGTALSFELGLLWPEFMKHAGPIIGMPFSLEGAAFFVEALAIGFYLYGWNKLDEKFHWITGVIIGVSGVASGILVVSANSWMNAPSGFDYADGKFFNIDPVQALLNPAWFTQALHMTLAAFAATGFAVAGIHAWQVYKNRNPEVHSKAFHIAIIFGAIAALLQPLSGDLSAKDVAERQPVKLAAMEAHYETGKGVPLFIGGIVDEKNKTVSHKIEIPKALSFLAFGDFDAEVKGLNDFPRDEIPPVAIPHYAFQIMVSMGGIMAISALVYFISVRKRKWWTKKWFWLAFAILAPAGYIALEAGWVVTEVGRQPWIIHKIMRTKDAVTPMPGMVYSFWFYVLLYTILTLTVIWLMRRQIKVLNENAIDMLYVVLFFLVVSFFLYVLLGGADFGAGIIELFSSTDNQKPIKKTVYEVMGPVWEANHIWIIIMVVILWIGFPMTYNIVVVYLHIPLTLVLLGITLRGAAFIFRHYDAIKGESQKLYDNLFRISCLITPIFLGMTFGTLVTGDIKLIEFNPDAGFYEIYVHPWLQIFPILIGCFYAALCSFLAAVFLIGEAKDEEKKMYIRKAKVAIIAVVSLGFLVLITGFLEGREFVIDFVSNPFALGSATLSGILLYPLWRAIRFGRVKRCRFFGGLQVALILFAAAITHFPNVIETTSGSLNFMVNLAPESVMKVLGISLIIGGLLIIPGLFHLLKSFKMIKMLEEKE